MWIQNLSKGKSRTHQEYTQRAVHLYLNSDAGRVGRGVTWLGLKGLASDLHISFSLGYRQLYLTLSFYTS